VPSPRKRKPRIVFDQVVRPGVHSLCCLDCGEFLGGLSLPMEVSKWLKANNAIIAQHETECSFEPETEEARRYLADIEERKGAADQSYPMEIAL
jgi:hypothetical protein